MFKNKKLFLLNIFLSVYIAITLIGGERGLISYFEKKKFSNSLEKKFLKLSLNYNILEKKNKLLSEKIDLDYLDTVYREKLKLGKINETIIRLK